MEKKISYFDKPAFLEELSKALRDSLVFYKQKSGLQTNTIKYVIDETETSHTVLDDEKTEIFVEPVSKRKKLKDLVEKIEEKEQEENLEKMIMDHIEKDEKLKRTYEEMKKCHEMNSTAPFDIM